MVVFYVKSDRLSPEVLHLRGLGREGWDRIVEAEMSSQDSLVPLSSSSASSYNRASVNFSIDCKRRCLTCSILTEP